MYIYYIFAHTHTNTHTEATRSHTQANVYQTKIKLFHAATPICAVALPSILDERNCNRRSTCLFTFDAFIFIVYYQHQPSDGYFVSKTRDRLCVHKSASHASNTKWFFVFCEQPRSEREKWWGCAHSFVALGVVVAGAALNKQAKQMVCLVQLFVSF